MKIAALIPARFASKRYPGKPLVKLLDRPMILHVCDVAAQAVGRERTYVATDSLEIANVVRDAGYAVRMTSDSCLTGTDRLAEAVEGMDVDVVINVQGDEPMVSSESIQRIIAVKRDLPGWVVNGMARLTPEENPASRDIPKVVANEHGNLLYMSRALLPAAKDATVVPSVVWKQVCIYAFELDHLRAFRAFGRKSTIENYEDIEILRFFELNVPVKMIELPSTSLAVDRPEDVAAVELAMRERLASG